MKTSNLTKAYWISTILFAIFLFVDGMTGILQTQGGKDIFLQLGYPFYLLTIIGTAKVLAGFAILQTKWVTLKEWAFAGFTIDCIGASLSHAFSHQRPLFIILPFVFLGVMFIPYILWKKVLKEKNT